LVLLQHKLEAEKFIKIWNMTYPQLENPEANQNENVG